MTLSLLVTHLDAEPKAERASRTLTAGLLLGVTAPYDDGGTKWREPCGYRALRRDPRQYEQTSAYHNAATIALVVLPELASSA